MTGKLLCDTIPPPPPHSKRSRSEVIAHYRLGFTLIELTIVLVISGLLAAGIVVGREMIVNAQMQKTIAQRSTFDTAVNTFKNKYGCLPSDCTKWQSLGLTDPTAYSDMKLGDGKLYDNVAESISSANLIFWQDLDKARLVQVAEAGNYESCKGNPCVSFNVISGDGILAGWVAFFATDVIIDSSNGIAIYNSNVYTLGGEFSDGSIVAAFTPSLAYRLDAKMDDGLPLSGKVGVIGDICTSKVYPIVVGSGGASSAVCVDNTVTPNRYNSLNDTSLVCTPIIKAGF